MSTRPGQPLIPGVPAAGHIAGNGFWHPGATTNCSKPPCKTTTRKKRSR